MSRKKDAQIIGKNYFCHIIIPSKNYEKSKSFFEGVFGWKVGRQPGTNFLDVLPPTRKGPSAELNSEVEVVIPSIRTSNIELKLELIERFGGKKIKGKTPVSKDSEQRYYALFEDPEGNKMCLFSRK